MAQRLFGVDAFTDEPFGGNPAAVVLLSAQPDDRWMQLVGREMNLSETAFLLPQNGGFSLRWFTPTVEVDLCGHATLASAHVLWETETLSPDEEARFETRSGLLTARRVGELIELNFPAMPPVEADPPAPLLEALGTTPVWCGRFGPHVLIEFPSDLAVHQMQPDIERLREADALLVIVTAPSSSEEYDFVSRVFCPNLGIPEDPVTGAAHCVLTPYWTERLGKSEMVAHQASVRGGVLHVALEGDRARIAGRAITTYRAELLA